LTYLFFIFYAPPPSISISIFIEVASPPSILYINIPAPGAPEVPLVPDVPDAPL